MQMDERHEGPVLIVSPKETALDAYAATSFRERMSECIAQGHHRIVLDLGEVDFLDSTGLGAIVSSYKRLDGRGSMVICNAREMVLDVFRLTRMDRVFTIVPSLERALEAVADRAA
jgi:anti-sigma B factor antagonist